MSRRIASNSVKYTENEELGELEVIADFLPSPQELAKRAGRASRIKVTITLESESVEFFKKIATEHKVPYQKMIRLLLDEYVHQHKQPVISSAA